MTHGSVFNQDVLGALELGFMLDNECACIGALHRTESQGLGNCRTDFPGETTTNG